MSPPGPSEGGRQSLRDISRMVFRQKWRVAGAAIAVLALTMVGAVMAPRKYASEARLYLRVGRETTALDPTATTGRNTINVDNPREYEVQSALDLLRSRVLAERVVDRIGASAVLAQRVPGELVAESAVDGWLDKAKDWVKGLIGANEVTAEEMAVVKLSKWLEIGAEKHSSVISVVCRCGSPRLAQLVVKELVDAYREEHLRMHRTTGSKAFFEQQASVLQEQLAGATARLRDAKNAVGLVSVEVQRHIIEEEIKALNVEMTRTGAALAAAEGKIEQLQQANPELLTSVRTQVASGLTAKALDDMRLQLYTLQIKEQELTALYLENHPELRAIREQVTEARNVLSQQELLVETSTAGTLRSQLASLQDKYDQSQRKLEELNVNEASLEKLEAEVTRLKDAYRQYNESYEVARIDEALLAERISNVNVLQEADYQARPVSPSRRMVIVMGILASLCAGAAVAITGELMDPTLKTPDEVESRLELPVLMTIPRLERHRVEVN